MANSIPSGITIEYDNSGGSLVDISQYVMTINGFSVEQILEEVHTFGDSWEEQLPVGIGRAGTVELGGLYDDTNIDALFAGEIPQTPTDNTRTLKITWVGAKTSSVETWLVNYVRSPDRGALTKYAATLQTTGAVTEA